MATQVFSYDFSGPGIRAILADGDDIWVSRTGLLVSTNEYTAINGLGSNHIVHIEGAVSGYDGVVLGDNATLNSGNSVVITRTGVVYGTNFGVMQWGPLARLDNFGLINGGVFFSGWGPGMSRIDNAGDIISNVYAAVQHWGDETLSLNNTGTIRSGAEAFLSFRATAIDLIRNRGEMIGDILLGGGDDRYDGRGGFIDGTVYGGDGSDTFRPGGGIELFDGGLGADTLDFRSTAGVKVYLDGSGPNTGTAAGDDYLGIENVQGSLRGADTLVGDAANNVLRGYGGADMLSGGNGLDRFIGGAGIDRLIGGLGDDRFVFEKPGDGGDVIKDFAAVVGNDDRFYFEAAGFGGGLVPGALAAGQFRTRADNLAQDGNDRFIFRTTDQTLWFDVNGNLAGGLTLVADLQASAVVTAADIFLF